MDMPTLDLKKLTPEQRDKLDFYQQTQDQLQVLQDIALMTQEVINVLDTENEQTEKLGILLTDMRESLTDIKSKETPETPDYAKPVVDAVKELEKALGASIKGIDVKPLVNVGSPEVNVAPPDLKGVEQAVKAIPKAFEQAIKLIPKVEVPETDFEPLVDKLESLRELLKDIDTGVRMKPLPGSMKVTNPDGTPIGGGLTDAQLRATPVPVVEDNSSGILTSVQLIDDSIKQGGTAISTTTDKYMVLGQRNTGGNATPLQGRSTTSDGLATNAAGNAVQTAADNYMFNGSTWDRLRGDTTYGLDVDVTRMPAPTAYATKITVSGTVTYIGKAVPGSSQASAVWQAQKVDETSGTVITWADGNANFDNLATDLTVLTYS